MHVTAKQKQYTLQQILTYLDCPLVYHLKYEKKIQSPISVTRLNKGLIYKESMDETIAYYYRGHLEKKPPTLKQMYDRFYSLWMEKTDTVNENSILTRRLEDSGHLTRQEISEHIQVGYNAIRSFYLKNNDLKQSILGVNFPFEIVLNSGVIVGHIPLIREVEYHPNQRRIEMLDFTTTKKRQYLDEKNISPHNVLLSFAFRSVMKMEPDRYFMHSLTQDELADVNVSANDYKKFFRMVNAFLQSVDTIEPYIPPNARYPDPFFKELCENYTFPTKA